MINYIKYYIPLGIYILIKMGIETILTKGSTKGNSLRTTVPISIVKQFGLGEGDILDWTLKVENNKLIIEVVPKRSR